LFRFSVHKWRDRPHRNYRAADGLAERQGFEPWIEFPLYTLSKRAPSATRPSLRITTTRIASWQATA
jgi:hypothetical protein